MVIPSKKAAHKRRTMNSRFFFFCVCAFAQRFISYAYILESVSETAPPEFPPLSFANASLNMHARWESVKGPHPLCHNSVLKQELAMAGMSPIFVPFLNTRPRSAAVIVIGLPWYNASDVIPLTFEIEKYFSSVDEFFLSRFGIDYVILFEEERGIDPFLLATFSRCGWRRVGSGSGSHLASGTYITPLGTKIIAKARPFRLPRYLQHTPSLLDDRTWRKCAGRRWPLGYLLYSGAGSCICAFLSLF